MFIRFSILYTGNVFLATLFKTTQLLSKTNKLSLGCGIKSFKDLPLLHTTLESSGIKSKKILRDSSVKDKANLPDKKELSLLLRFLWRVLPLPQINFQ